MLASRLNCLGLKSPSPNVAAPFPGLALGPRQPIWPIGGPMVVSTTPRAPG